MSRIRTIKPEFFTSEDIVDLTPLARLLYIGLWCEADREGRFSWKPKTLKMRYLPGDECEFDSVGNELINAGLVDLYEIENSVYAEIPSFKRHQVINNREAESNIPPNNGQKPQIALTRESGVQTRESGRKEGKGKEGKERKGKTREINDEKFKNLTLPDWLPLDDWNAFVEERKASRHPMTEKAAEMAISELDKLRQKGHDPSEVIRQSIINGWRGLFPLKSIVPHPAAQQTPEPVPPYMRPFPRAK